MNPDAPDGVITLGLYEKKLFRGSVLVSRKEFAGGLRGCPGQGTPGF
jgi:hypothetical protein